MRHISSRHNPLVRTFRDLADAPDAEGTRLLLDGPHVVHEARAAGLRLELVAVASTQLEGSTEAASLAHALAADGVDVVAVSDAVMSAISPVRTPSGIVAIGTRAASSADAICAHPAALVVVAVNLQDPGNLGALVRAAEAGGATGVIVCGASAHAFSWKTIRGSMGSVLRMPVATLADAGEALARCTSAGLHTVAAVPHVGRAPQAVDWTLRSAVFLGGEGPGLPAEVARACAERVTIPMQPPVESLNVAVAGALLVYEARRQRHDQPFPV